MKSTFRSVIGRAASSSVAVHFVRQVIADSRICAAVRAVTRAFRRIRDRVVVGLGGGWSVEDENRTTSAAAALVSNSRITAVLSSLATVAAAATGGASVKRALDPILALDLEGRVRALAYVIVIAVLTHTLLLSVLGVHVYSVGWNLRVLLVTVCLLMAHRPRPWAVAWSDRFHMSSDT